MRKRRRKCKDNQRLERRPLVIYSIVCGILSAVVCAWVGSWYGETYAREFSVVGLRGSHAVGFLGLILGLVWGAVLGLFIGWGLVKLNP